MAAQIGFRALDRLSDEHIVELCKVTEDADALEHLLKKYKSVVLFKSRSYFLQGADRDDMIQEGMVGLYKAIRDFRPDRSCSFRTFADVCITSAIEIRADDGPVEAFRLPEVAGVAVTPARAQGRKCARSWRISPLVGTDPQYPDVTPRDADALRELKSLGRWG